MARNLVAYKRWNNLADLPNFGFVIPAEFKPDTQPHGNKKLWAAFNSNKTCVCSVEWRILRRYMGQDGFDVSSDLFAIAEITKQQRNRYRK